MGLEVIEKSSRSQPPEGEIVTIDGERCYAINNVERMPPFFMSIVSDSDHWLFISSTGGLTAGRCSPATSLFPYVSVDKIHDSTSHTGCKTLLRVRDDKQVSIWEPFNEELVGYYNITRTLYKSLLGNSVHFEEVNHDLNLTFRYAWHTSAEYGFVRTSQLVNLRNETTSIEIIDGFENILPAGTPAFSQTNTSNLVDAYKWTELDVNSGLALYTLYSAITDRAEPAESLRANTVFALGLTQHNVLISSDQIKHFRMEKQPVQETLKRGIRGSYFINTISRLAPKETQRWQLVANIEQDQRQVAKLQQQLRSPSDVRHELDRSIAKGNDRLARIIASADGFQTVEEDEVSVHHYANVLFNVLRGGIFDDQYKISTRDLAQKIAHFNKAVFARHVSQLHNQADKLNVIEVRNFAEKSGDPQLERLCLEYLPIAFGRRHGDPSRPWNEFSIKLKDDHGHPLLCYQGNWRDIFQNWEALVFSFPEYTESMIAKFVNASTMDGHNPYRITSEGIDWEIEDPDDPWSYIGYWGDHQIIYLLKFLELSSRFNPMNLHALLRKSIFSYANVPYRIRSFEALLSDPKDTIDFDWTLAAKIDERTLLLGADGKCVVDRDNQVYLVNLTEKLLVPLLAKLSNLVVDGGIWLNTQRPEWNDANNALVGQGLSMVTLYYLRRYIVFLRTLLSAETDAVVLTNEVAEWLNRTAATYAEINKSMNTGALDPKAKFAFLKKLGTSAESYRESVYQHDGDFRTTSQKLSTVFEILDDALSVIDHSIQKNRRNSGLYHAYNLIVLNSDSLTIETLYPMLEGQVAALSSNGVPLAKAADVIEKLFDSKLYRQDQHSFMLYPDRALPDFLHKNIIPPEEIKKIPFLERLLEIGNQRLVLRDTHQNYRFNADCINLRELDTRLNSLTEEFEAELEQARKPIHQLYEKVFNHTAFTGRSGGMFGFEGLGSIYWHMVAKLLLAVQENFSQSLSEGSSPETTQRLGSLYYQVRHGLGFNKTPSEYGAFPTDPYSHSPKHAGAQQPGMTGQVKEEILTRFGELGIRVSEGCVTFNPRLLRHQEFLTQSKPFRYLAVDNEWHEIALTTGSLGFTWCQVPIVYELLDKQDSARLQITNSDNVIETRPELALTDAESRSIFKREGVIEQIRVSLPPDHFFSDRPRSS